MHFTSKLANPMYSVPYNFIPSEVIIHTTCNNQICQETGLIHGWLNVPHRLSTHFSAMLQDRLHLFVAFCTLAYCAFQKHANSKVQKPTDVFCYVFCCRQSSQYPASRGPSIFLETYLQQEDFEGPLLAGCHLSGPLRKQNIT